VRRSPVVVGPPLASGRTLPVGSPASKTSSAKSVQQPDDALKSILLMLFLQGYFPWSSKISCCTERILFIMAMLNCGLVSRRRSWPRVLDGSVERLEMASSQLFRGDIFYWR
jgi:hypothetical protein